MCVCVCVVCVRDLEVALQILDYSIGVCIGQESSHRFQKKLPAENHHVTSLSRLYNILYSKRVVSFVSTSNIPPVIVSFLLSLFPVARRGRQKRGR